jgi:thiol:disulfide interchange protein DsbC
MMRKMKKLTLLFIGLTCFGQAAIAGTEELANVKKVLASVMPNAEPDSVMESAMPGIYEAVFGAQVVYLSSDGRYMIEGDVYDLKQRVNLTEDRRKGGRVKAVASIEKDSMIVFSPKGGKPKHSITAFTDIDCGYCRKLHEQINSYEDLGIEVRYAAYPRAGFGSKSFYKAEAVWCATDPRKTMTFAKSGATLEQLRAVEQVSGKDCKETIRKHMEVAKDVGVTGTPSLVMTNGKVIPGFVPPDRLLKILDSENNKI